MNTLVASQATADDRWPEATYRLSEALQERTRSDSVHRPAPDEAEFEDLLFRKLGRRGWGRVLQFRKYYTPGWGTGVEKPLSPKALGGFSRFLGQVAFPKDKEPSVFLTDRGGLEVVWEDANSKSIQLEFTSSGVEFYHEAKDEEGFIRFEEIPSLVGRIATL